jgi:hypothetical protein
MVWLTADDQTITRTIPFRFGLYGCASDSASICSNGFLVLGRSDFRGSINGEVPGSGVGWIMAGFWTDLDPSHWGGGRVYEYFDAARHRYIVEFSRVEHYHPAGAGVPETFQLLLYDPEFWPTQTGDGELVIQYLDVNDPTLCSVGIQNGDRTIGTQYAALGEVNAATYRVATGRAIKFSTTGPSGIVGAGNGVGSRPVTRPSARPNPFRVGTTIAYGLPYAAIQVFGLDGTLLRTLREGFLPAGGGRVWWDDTDRHPARAARWCASGDVRRQKKNRAPAPAFPRTSVSGTRSRIGTNSMKRSTRRLAKRYSSPKGIRSPKRSSSSSNSMRPPMP